MAPHMTATTTPGLLPLPLRALISEPAIKAALLRSVVSTAVSNLLTVQDTCIGNTCEPCPLTTSERLQCSFIDFRILLAYCILA